MAKAMNKLQLWWQNLDRVFNFRIGRVFAMHLLSYGVKLPNLKQKTEFKQLLNFAFQLAVKIKLIQIN